MAGVLNSTPVCNMHADIGHRVPEPTSIISLLYAPFLLIFSYIPSGLAHLGLSLPLPPSLFLSHCVYEPLCLSPPVRAPFFSLSWTPAAVLANLTHSETATSKHLIFPPNRSDTSGVHPRTAETYALLYVLIWLICSLDKWAVGTKVAHESRNKSQLVLLVLVLYKLKHNLIQLGK